MITKKELMRLSGLLHTKLKIEKILAELDENFGGSKLGLLATGAGIYPELVKHPDAEWLAEYFCDMTETLRNELVKNLQAKLDEIEEELSKYISED